MAKLLVSTANAKSVSADALILPLLKGAEKDADAVVPGFEELSALITALKPSASAESVTVVPAPAEFATRKLYLVGLGEKSLADVTTQVAREVFGAAARSAAGDKKVALALPGANSEVLAAAAEGAALGAYRFNDFRGKDADLTAPVAEFELLAEESQQSELNAAVSRAQIVADSVFLTRNLVNTPPNELFPASFAEKAGAAVEDLPVEIEVLDEKALLDGGYGGIYGVGRGSARPPRLVKLSYRPSGASKHVALVGKGITFDTGGISLKPPAKMWDMTSDMAGAATVLGTVVAAARLELPVQVTGFLAIAENMPGGNAQRPGDVVTMRNGKTVEVLNTDAEGRMVMADALVDAAALEPDLIMDVATLTGAAVLALGTHTAAVMGEDDAVEQVLTAKDDSGEYFWPLPFPKEMAKSLRGQIADLANIGQREGGCMVAGLFLKEFVDGKNWAHLDIAGPAWAHENYAFYQKGSTGFGVRTMLQVIENLGK